MPINVTYVGGPLEGLNFRVDALDEVRAFFPHEERRVFMYRRDPMICELCYIYDHALSKSATERYDETYDFFNNRKPAPPAPVDDGSFQYDKPILGGSGLSADPDDGSDNLLSA